MRKYSNIKYINESRIAIMSVDVTGLTFDEADARVQEVDSYYGDKLEELGTNRLLVIPNTIAVQSIPELSPKDQVLVSIDLSKTDPKHHAEFSQQVAEAFARMFEGNEVLIYANGAEIKTSVKVERK